MVEYINGLQIGEDIIRAKIFDVIFNVSGVEDVTVLTLNGGTSNIAVADDEEAEIDTSNVTVTS